MSGGGSTSTVKEKADPWKPQQPFLKFGFDEARNIYENQMPEYFPDSTVAPQSDATLAAQNLQIARALSGNPLLGASQGLIGDTIEGSYLNANPNNPLYEGFLGAQNNPAMQYLTSTAQGDFINANPYIDQTFDNIASRLGQAYQENVVPGVDGRAVASGRYGSGAWQGLRADAADDFGRNLSETANQLYGDNYARERANQLAAANSLQGAHQFDQGLGLNALNSMNQNYMTERARQMAASQFAPQLAQADYADIGALGQAGSMQDQFNQALLSDDVNRFNYEQQLPMNWLADYMGLVQGNYGGQSTQTTSSGGGSNIFGNTLGGALSGASLFGSGGALAGTLGMTGPYGALLGGGLGLLGSIL